MWDEIRGHSPKPDAEEREWLRTDPFRAVVRTLALAAIALALGTAVSLHRDIAKSALIASAQGPPPQ